MAQRSIPNGEIAAVLREIADLLEAKGENAFRVRSYRTAAASVEGAKSPVDGIAREKGIAGLQGLDGVGEKIAGLIEEYVQKGEVELLKSLEKDLPKEKRPDGQKKPPPKHDFAVKADVPVELILSIDAEYRDKARAGQLKKIAPRLQNPEKKAWLPVMAKESKGFKFTVMFSNTATAHQLEKTNDWVVVYSAKGKGEDQCTVVTEHRGTLKGKRVIRGREKECAAYYKV